MRLQAQLDILVEAEEPTRKAMGQWCDLITAHLPLTTYTEATAAAEHGAHLLDFQIEEEGGRGNSIPDSPTLDKVVPVSKRMEWCHETMERLAKTPQAAGAVQGQGSPASHQALERLVQRLYVERELQFKPFEWMYTGLAPLRLAEVLRGGTGAPLVMGIAAASIARRAGIPSCLTPSAEAPATDHGMALPQRLSRAQLPNLSSSQWWYLMAAELPGQAQDAVPLDVTSGKPLESGVVAPLKPQASALSAWRGLVRLAVEAHQRRGESDAVAHWTHVLLSLDPLAPEWAVMLGDR